MSKVVSLYHGFILVYYLNTMYCMKLAFKKKT